MRKGDFVDKTPLTRKELRQQKEAQERKDQEELAQLKEKFSTDDFSKSEEVFKENFPKEDTEDPFFKEDSKETVKIKLPGIFSKMNDFFNREERKEERKEDSLKVDDTMTFTKEDVLRVQKELEKQEKRKNREISKKYDKLNKKNSPIKKSRQVQQEKSRERNHTLNIALVVVAILLGILIFLVFNW